MAEIRLAGRFLDLFHLTCNLRGRDKVNFHQIDEVKLGGPALLAETILSEREVTFPWSGNRKP